MLNDSNILLHLLNYSTFCLCLVSKIPSIVLVARAKSSKGFSLKGLLLELTGYVVFVTYQIHHAAPSSTFLEYPILIAQGDVAQDDAIMCNDSCYSLMFHSRFVGGWKLVTLQDWIIDLAMSLCTLISASSKFASAQCLYQSKDSSGVSALAWSISCYTCLAHSDQFVAFGSLILPVLTRFAVLSSLNGFVLAMIFHYRRDVKKVE
uniref:Solute carrier family 66 member 3 n=1 Tax=Oncorhynchus mykiss TaxID=8022 RepID=A0A8K9WP86_ONCMY